MAAASVADSYRRPGGPPPVAVRSLPHGLVAHASFRRDRRRPGFCIRTQVWDRAGGVAAVVVGLVASASEVERQRLDPADSGTTFRADGGGSGSDSIEH